MGVSEYVEIISLLTDSYNCTYFYAPVWSRWDYPLVDCGRHELYHIGPMATCCCCDNCGKYIVLSGLFALFVNVSLYFSDNSHTNVIRILNINILLIKSPMVRTTHGK